MVVGGMVVGGMVVGGMVVGGIVVGGHGGRWHGGGWHGGGWHGGRRHSSRGVSWQSRGVSLHPVNKVGDLGVDSRVVKSSTSNAPADNASKITRSISVVADHGATTVTLTTVLAILSSTNHALGNLEGVLKLAASLSNNRN